MTLPGKPAAVISGTSGADEGFATIRNALRKVEEELQKAGIAPAGRPVAVFQHFNADGSFNYDAMIPIERRARRPHPADERDPLRHDAGRPGVTLHPQGFL